MLIAVSSRKKYNPVKSAEKRVFQLPKSSFGLKNRVYGQKSSFISFREIEFLGKRTKKKPAVVLHFLIPFIGVVILSGGVFGCLLW